MVARCQHRRGEEVLANMTSQTLLDWHETGERRVEPVGRVCDVEGFASEGVHFGGERSLQV